MGALPSIALGAIALVSLLTAGCGSGAPSDLGSTSAPGIMLSTGPVSPAPDGSSTQQPRMGADSAGPQGTVDPTADLDIDDQRGDGSQVIVESLATSLTGVTLVLLDSKGKTVAAIPVAPGVQPVAVELDVTLVRSQELRGVLMAPDGAGMLVDDEGEVVEEDFDYVIR